MDHLAAELGVRPRLLGALRRDLGPQDLTALAGLTRVIRHSQPEILHTHMAKAGTLGRLAALLAGRERPPIRVHTFHGHVLSGYFSRPREAVFTRIERSLAHITTRLVAVSDEVREDLVRLRIAPVERIEVIPLGLDLEPFRIDSPERELRRSRARTRLGLARDARVVTLVARLVPIKRVDRFLRIAERVPDARFLVVGDGQLHDALRGSPEAKRLGSRVVWAGLQRDMPDVMAASDVVALTSDNEGTPVSLIEAQAAGLPVVSTDVGGVASVVLEGVSGRVLPTGDERGFAAALEELLADADLAGAYGSRGREHVLEHFSIDRLVRDVDGLYRRLGEEQAV